jgi:class 3 adenylate cyclase/predicted ATPase
MDIGGWLRSLGLGKYEAAFRENEIDETVLPSLTEEHLKQLGVTALGHRVKLLDAIAALRTDASAQGPLGDPKAAPGVSPTPEDRAERRQVTVMFSDLVGSTALSARMDPEDLREVISAYQNCVAETVQRFGGFVAKYMGDGVLVYFGYPQAHEDDAERSVRAALELVQAVGSLKSSVPLQTRVGIATGLVVVGDLIGTGSAQEQTVVGETPNLAARMQGIAEPNAVVIAESTRKLLGNLFDLQDLGARDLKGVGSLVRPWAVMRPASVESRFEALHASGLTELIGREEELELLLRRWSKAKAGEGQVVLLSGEAGIGKSRLTAALLERLTNEPHTRLRYFCSPQHTDSALYPVIVQMARAAAFGPEDSVQVKLDKLDALLVQTVTSKHDVALLAEMLSLPNDGRYPAIELPPEQRRRRTFEALVSQLLALTQKSPVLMIFEDAHWTDPTSLEVFGLIIDRIRSIPVLLLVTFRPEFDAPWAGRPYVSSLALNRLGERDISAMIDRVVGNNMLPANIRQDIIERTDGIPLFVEEMTKAILEAGSEGDVQRTVASIPSRTLGVPASLQASLMARLDRLGSAKEVAQIGAAIGREFSHTLLSAVARKSAPELASALDRLISAGLLFRQGVPPHASYMFKHTLVQDAAYGTLLREPRRALHARIIETLEDKFADIAENQPELLARHCTEAGLIEKAVRLWGKAGQRSLRRSALLEAVEQLTRALSQIPALPATPALRREEIELQVSLITPLMHLKGHNTPESRAAVEKARLLIEQAEALGEYPEDPLLLFSVLYGFCTVHLFAFNSDLLRELSVQFYELAQRQRAAAPLMVGHRLMGLYLAYTGNMIKAREHYDQSLALYDPAQHRPLATRFGHDTRVAVLVYRSLVLWCLGFPEAAIADTEDGLKDAREMGLAHTMLFALFQTSLTRMHCGDYSAASTFADELRRLADEKDIAIFKAGGVIIHGWISAQSGKASDAIKAITSGIPVWKAVGMRLFMPLSLSSLARAYGDLGQFDDAWRCSNEATSTIEAGGERWYEAEVNRIAGEIALKSPQTGVAKAQVYFERALAVARQQQAKSWELRAAMSMARLWRDQGKRDEARELLAPVYGWFTEGFDTRDLKEAKALLDELAS